MPSYTNNKTVEPVKASDLKKAIVKKNKELKASISTLKKSEKELQVRIDNAKKTLKKSEDLIFDKQMALDSIDVTLLKKEDILKDKEEQLKEVINSLSLQMSERVLITEEIASKEEVLDKYKQDLTDLQIKIKDLESKEQVLADIQEDIKKYRKTASVARSSAKKAKADCKLIQAKSNEEIKSIQENVDYHNRALIDIEDQLKSKVIEYKNINTNQDKAFAEREEQLRFALDKKKDMETAISNYDKEIKDLQNLLDLKKKEIQKVKSDYKSFKLKAFDEMARLKMKGKLENKDKAGLADVFTK